MLKQIKKNENGFVFIMTIAIILIAMVLTATIISLNTFHATQNNEEARLLQQEMLAKGGHALFVADQLSGSPSAALTQPVTLNGQDFTIEATRVSIGNGYLNTDQIDVSVK